MCVCVPLAVWATGEQSVGYQVRDAMSRVLEGWDKDAEASYNLSFTQSPDLEHDAPADPGPAATYAAAAADGTRAYQSQDENWACEEHGPGHGPGGVFRLGQGRGQGLGWSRDVGPPKTGALTADSDESGPTGSHMLYGYSRRSIENMIQSKVTPHLDTGGHGRRRRVAARMPDVPPSQPPAR